MKNIVTKRVDGEAISEDEEEPLSPQARIYLDPLFNVPIIGILGFKTSVNIGVMIEGLKSTLFHHPRFSSKVVIDDGEGRVVKWVRTKINVNDHIIVPHLSPTVENPDQFVEDYVSNLSAVPMDLSKPLWEFHILNVETIYAESVGVFRINHAIGDGASLISLILACTRKMSDPEALPNLPVQKRSKQSSVTSGRFFWLWFLSIWTSIKLIWNTIMDLAEFVATIIFLKDTKNPLIGEYEADDPNANKRRLVHRTVNLNDLKLVRKAMNTTVNDVVMGATQAGLSRYLSRSHGNVRQDNDENSDSYVLPKSNRFRALVIFNLRAVGIQASADMIAKGSKVGWGNKIGYVFLPSKMVLYKDPLDYIREAKYTMDRKKNSLAALCIAFAAGYLIKMFGDKAYVGVSRKAFANTSFTFSNVVGPTEEIGFYGHPINFLASATFGIPQALTVHFQSYVDKMTLVITADPNVISDPHRLCDDIKESLHVFADTVIARGLVKHAL